MFHGSLLITYNNTEFLHTLFANNTIDNQISITPTTDFFYECIAVFSFTHSFKHFMNMAIIIKHFLSELNICLLQLPEGYLKWNNL